MRVRWKFVDGGTTYTFEQNPREMSSPYAPHTTEARPRGAIDSRYRPSRQPRQPHQWTFSGGIRSKAFYDQLVLWLNKPGRFTVIDHFGRQFTVRIVSFEATPKRSRNVEWRFEYTITALVFFGPEPVSAPGVGSGSAIAGVVESSTGGALATGTGSASVGGIA